MGRPVTIPSNEQQQYPRVSSPVSTVPENNTSNVLLPSSEILIRRPSRRPPRKKASYALAVPPPGAHRHLPGDRALIVQVQRLSNASRPIPVFDAVPASVFQSKLKKVHHCFKHGLGSHDIALVTSEEYEGQDEDDQSDEGNDQRRIVATISQVNRKGHYADEGRHKMTVISQDDGRQWEASPLASGGYEFVSVDEDGFMRVAKWLPKSSLPRRRSYQPGGLRSPDLEAGERKFHFSITDKVTGKRPIVAWLNGPKVDILERHPGSQGEGKDSPLQSPCASADEYGSPLSRQSSPEETEFCVLPETLRIFIIATGIWVTLRENSASSTRTDIEVPMSPSTLNFRNSLNGRPTSLQFPSSGSTVSTPVQTPQKELSPAFDDSISKKVHRRGTYIAHKTSTANKEENLTGLSLPQRARSLSAGTSKLYALNRLSRGGTPKTPTPTASRPVTPVMESPPTLVTPDLPMGLQPRKSYSAPSSPAIRTDGVRRFDGAMRGVDGAGLRGKLDEMDARREKRGKKWGLRNMVSHIFKKGRDE